MWMKGSLYRGGLFFAQMCAIVAAWVIIGCATSTTTTTERSSKEPGPVVIEAIMVSNPVDNMTAVEIVSSTPAPYTAFQLTDPPRLVLDVRAVPGADVPPRIQVKDRNVNDILLDKGKARAMTSRVVVNLVRAVDYKVAEKDRSITLTLTPKRIEVEAAAPQESKLSMTTKGSEGGEFQPSKPRIFFKPHPIALNQVLGVDFTMLAHGRSRLSVTTDKKVGYGLKRKGPKTVVLTLEETVIPPLLLRHLDSSHFEGTVDQVKPSFDPTDNRLSLFILLREMVPFHVNQTQGDIHIDFGATAIRPPEKSIMPVKLPEPQKNSPELTLAKQIAVPKEPVGIPGLKRVRYKGTPMTMNFVNADVTNILRLIGEVSKLNIIWGPEVKGTVSMRLEKVPWDQALDLVLANNDLAMRRQGKVIWITTRAHMAKLEEEEKKKREQAEAEIEARRKKRLEAKEQVEKEEPLITDYITVNYGDVEAVKSLIEENVKGPRGKLSVDKANKTIIITDIASNVQRARELKKRQDKPTKQVMIEARIVEATTTFSRDIGVEWSGSYQAAHDNKNYLYSFATNFTNMPTAATLGINFANTSLTTLLNAQIALAETEGQVKTLSAPKVVTRDTVQATITQGTEIYVPSGRDDNGNIIFEAKDAALKLKVTPRITPNNMVILKIMVEDNAPDYANATGELIPIKKKRAETEMMVATGDTVVIGGIYKETKSDTKEATPWLGEIPLLGWLFKVKGTSSEKSELLIFLTPTVVQEPTDR
jgi:type IV pilus assembly protein PilQ